MSPSLTTIVTSSPISNPGSPWTSKSGSQGGVLTLLSPIESSSGRKSGNKSVSKSPTPRVQSDPHAFRPAGPTDSRCPCPALNTLANHGYLPHDGKNITISNFIEALQHLETYNLSSELALVLAKGGAVTIDHSISHLPGVLFNDNTSISLHDLALHGGVEHNASIVHKDTARGEKYAPVRTDTGLLNGFLKNRPTLELGDVAHRRAELEHVSEIDWAHAEVARGEWALVLDIFGKAHGGKMSTDDLRVWLHDNRFPDGWHPDHQQGLAETVETSRKLKKKMVDIKEHGLDKGSPVSYAELARQLRSDPEDVGKHGKEY